MDKEETHRLYREGKEAWNTWAEKMLTQKKHLIKRGKWEEQKNEWENSASATFANLQLIDGISGYVFPGRTVFSGCGICGRLTISRAQFQKNVSFANCIFNSKADFSNSIFESADFTRAKFNNDATFCHTRFKHQVSFNQFIFNKEINFYAAQIDGGFDLSGANFAVVPDFIQAHFLEAPGLDGVSIPEDVPPLSKKAVIARIPQSGIIGRSSESEALDSPIVSADAETRGMTVPSNLTARYRALKRMAIQAHDHKNEQNFFAAELKSMRDVPWFTWQGWWWRQLGRVYEILSDFGRSFFRPIWWWGVSVLFFAHIYLSLRTHGESECIVGVGKAVWAGIGLSFLQGLFPFGSVSGNRDVLHACLYGVHPQYGAEGARPVPMIPQWLIAVEAIQTLFSLLLIFLLLLSIRAHFRVK